MEAGDQTDPDGLGWRDGVPVSHAFGDPYFSLAGGFDEARHVFLAGNDLPARLRPGFRVAELGFGTGLNLLALAEVATVPVHFTSFELHPLPEATLARAHAEFPTLAPLAAQLRAGLARGGPVTVGTVTATIVPGDARATLPAWGDAADAWFLDGFAPAKNPELWGEALLAEVARHTAPDGTAATYSAAGSVRRGLAAAGFAVERRPGFARKRHMSVARLAAPR